MGKFYKTILALFIFLSFIYPAVNADIDFDFAYDFQESEDVSQAESYENSVCVKILSVLENAGYGGCTADCDIDIDGEEIIINNVSVYVPDGYDIRDVEDCIYKELGIVAEVYKIGE